MTYYAHSNKLGKQYWQTVREHLNNTANIARELGIDAGVAELAYVAAMLHDIGKYSDAFQRRLEGAGFKVDHSTAGAKEARQLFQDDPVHQIMGTILAYCIAGHHSGLLNYGSPIDIETDGTLWARLKKEVEDYQIYKEEIKTEELRLPAYLPIRPITKDCGFSLAFFTRMVYSALVDADFLETEAFMNSEGKPRGGYDDVSVLKEKLDHSLDRFKNPDSPINQQRTETLKNCIAKATEKPGLFTLTVPTGGGKTLSSLAFALHHAALHGMKRIIYVIPYTSIIEQNAAIFKNCLGYSNVLEHHSNFNWDQKQNYAEAEQADDQTNNAIQKLKLATENWDIPIVVTTNVQFFESLFANRSSRCRKLHNIAKSVIIFDEAQMLPRDYLKPCMYAVYELVKNYSATAILCTATQPSVEQFLPKEAELQELSTDPQSLYRFYKRVQVKHIGIKSDDYLTQQMNANQQTLCIVNTRRHARGLFEKLNNEGRFHLSTLMCPAHRKRTIAKIKETLCTKKPCRVISTQIMEAGIDIDFPVGFRAISGLDSIIQAAGRVNREGKQSEGTLYVFEPDSAFVKRTPAYIRQGAEVARNILRNYADPVCMEAIHDYYELLYDLKGKEDFDKKNIFHCFEKGDPSNLNFDFKTASEKFRLIENNTASIVIQYDQTAISLLDKARISDFPLSFSRELQPYTVNIYQNEFNALQAKGLIDLYGDAYAVLNDMGYYNAETGLQIPESVGGEALFFDG